MLITKINTGRWSRLQLETLIREGAGMDDPGDRIEFLSRQFLGIPYRPSTLTGSAADGETLVVDLASVDCFTLLDYVEALRHARSFEEFTEDLIRTRYRDGLVSFETRNHFFTDWPLYNAASVRDVTVALGGKAACQVQKLLNRKQDGSLYIQGVSPVVRDVAYLRPEQLSGGGCGMLLTGDYAGIYSDQPGLDVSHVGIIVREGEDIIFRHASALRGEVLDEDFRSYSSDRPGVIILRPR